MRKLVLWMSVLVLGVLLGFVPQYVKARRLQQQANFCSANLQLAEVQRLAALTYLSATQLNYGVAAGYADQFFNQLQRLAGSSHDAALDTTLGEVLSSRDKITADLAKGNPQVVSELQPILLKLEQSTTQ
jgi:hypothetical protein